MRRTWPCSVTHQLRRSSPTRSCSQGDGAAACSQGVGVVDTTTGHAFRCTARATRSASCATAPTALRLSVRCACVQQRERLHQPSLQDGQETPGEVSCRPGQPRSTRSTGDFGLVGRADPGGQLPDLLPGATLTVLHRAPRPCRTSTDPDGRGPSRSRDHHAAGVVGGGREPCIRGAVRVSAAGCRPGSDSALADQHRDRELPRAGGQGGLARDRWTA